MGQGLELIKRAYEVYDSHDMGRIRAEFSEELFTDDFELEGPMGQFSGEGVFAMWEMFLTAFPDVHHTILRSVEEGNTVVVEGTYAGTHLGPLAAPDGSEIPATGRSIDIPYAHFGVLEQGRFSAWRVYFDMAGFMQQLGLMPEPETASA